MRDMETCRAEIFRRSGERIRRRQRRRRTALTLCVPLALCLVIGLTVGPDWVRVGRANKGAENQLPSSGEKATQVTVLPLDGGEEWFLTKTAAEELQAILGGVKDRDAAAEELQAILGGVKDRDAAGNSKHEDEKDKTSVYASECEIPNDAEFFGTKADDQCQESASTEPTATAALEEPAYRITLRQGEEAVDYMLTVDGLVEELTGEPIPLTEEELAELRAVLGID